jgi:hypothetical protein
MSDSEPIVDEAEREAARMEMQLALSLRDALMAETLASLRWSQASLLLINGAGAAAVAGLNVSAGGKVAAGATFVLGMLLTLWAAAIGMRRMTGALSRISQNAGYWLSVIHDGSRVLAIEQAYSEFSHELSRKAFPAIVALWAAAVCFAGGCAAAGYSLLVSPTLHP